MGNFNTNRYVLYRIFGSGEELLYVGATTNPGRRFTEHSVAQPWWDEATNITLERCDTLEALLEAERVAIDVEGPRYNTHGMVGSAWACKPRRQKGEGSLFQRADGYWVASVEIPSRGKRRLKRAVRKSKADARRRLDEMLAEIGSSGA